MPTMRRRKVSPVRHSLLSHCGTNVLKPTPQALIQRRGGLSDPYEDETRDRSDGNLSEQGQSPPHTRVNDSGEEERSRFGHLGDTKKFSLAAQPAVEQLRCVYILKHCHSVQECNSLLGIISILYLGKISTSGIVLRFKANFHIITHFILSLTAFLDRGGVRNRDDKVCTISL